MRGSTDGIVGFLVCAVMLVFIGLTCRNERIIANTRHEGTVIARRAAIVGDKSGAGYDRFRLDVREGDAVRVMEVGPGVFYSLGVGDRVAWTGRKYAEHLALVERAGKLRGRR